MFDAHIFSPFPGRPRMDDETWRVWSESRPCLGHEFEMAEIAEDGTRSAARRAIYRYVAERRNGIVFTCQPMVVFENGDVAFGFSRDDKVVWRHLSVIVQEDCVTCMSTPCSCQ